MQTRIQASQFMSTENIDELLARVMPMAEAVNVGNDISPSTAGAINTVAAAGIEISDASARLLILKSNGDITKDEFLRLSGHFIDLEFQ